MAIGVLNIFDEASIDLINGVILLQKIPYYNMNCLEMASEARSQKFLSVTSVQNLLTEIWFGKIDFKNGLKSNLKVGNLFYKQ
jgi:hypothetical protein